MSRVPDLTGAVVGMLRAERFVRMSEYEQGQIWLCTCLGCGRELERLGTQLRRSLKDRVRSGCSDCRRAIRRIRSANARRQRVEMLKEVYATTGSLYGAGFDERFERSLRADFEAAGYQADSLESRSYVVTEVAHGQHGGGGDVHYHGMSLEEVAKEFDITGEAVRQIEVKALAKLRRRDGRFLSLLLRGVPPEPEPNTEIDNAIQRATERQRERGGGSNGHRAAATTRDNETLQAWVTIVEGSEAHKAALLRWRRDRVDEMLAIRSDVPAEFRALLRDLLPSKVREILAACPPGGALPREASA